MTPEERAKEVLKEFKGQFDRELLASCIAEQIRDAIREERDACIQVAASFSDKHVVQCVQDELTRSGMDPTRFSMAAWVGIMISRRPQP